MSASCSIRHDNWQRVHAWLGERAAQRSKACRQAKWGDEYRLFRVQFSDHLPSGGGEADGPTAPPVFIASVTQALLRPPDERIAAGLWAVLEREHFTGTRVGTIAAVPLGADNVGRRMLLAMGWRAGTGLGPRCERGWNRRARRGAWQPRDPAPAPRPWLLRRGETEARERKSGKPQRVVSPASSERSHFIF